MPVAGISLHNLFAIYSGFYFFWYKAVAAKLALTYQLPKAIYYIC